MTEIRMKYPRIQLDQDVYEAIAKRVGDGGVEEFANELLRKQLMDDDQNIRRVQE